MANMPRWDRYGHVYSAAARLGWIARGIAENVNPEYHSGTEIPPGPGLFTGKAGSWELEPPDVFGDTARDPTKPRKVPRKK